MTSHWKAILGVILIFVLGFVSGTVCTSIVAHRKLVAFLKHPGAVAEAALEKKLTHNLALDKDQKREVHDYFLENLQSRRELSKQIEPQERVANLETFQKINAILHPDQQQTFRQNIEEFKNRFKTATNTDGENIPVPAGLPTTSGTNAPTSH